MPPPVARRRRRRPPPPPPPPPSPSFLLPPSLIVCPSSLPLPLSPTSPPMDVGPTSMEGYGCGVCMSWSPGGPDPGVGPEIASPGEVEQPRIFTSSVLRAPEKV
eukprot:4479122-Pyramimonas_sp.AAC.1